MRLRRTAALLFAAGFIAALAACGSTDESTITPVAEPQFICETLPLAPAHVEFEIINQFTQEVEPSVEDNQIWTTFELNNMPDGYALWIFMVRGGTCYELDRDHEDAGYPESYGSSVNTRRSPTYTHSVFTVLPQVYIPSAPQNGFCENSAPLSPSGQVCREFVTDGYEYVLVMATPEADEAMRPMTLDNDRLVGQLPPGAFRISERQADDQRNLRL